MDPQNAEQAGVTTQATGLQEPYHGRQEPPIRRTSSGRYIQTVVSVETVTTIRNVTTTRSEIPVPDGYPQPLLGPAVDSPSPAQVVDSQRPAVLALEAPPAAETGGALNASEGFSPRDVQERQQPIRKERERTVPKTEHIFGARSPPAVVQIPRSPAVILESNPRHRMGSGPPRLLQEISTLSTTTTVSEATFLEDSQKQFNTMFSVVVSTVMMLAYKQFIIPESHRQWTLEFLQLVKDGEGKTPFNIAGVLWELEHCDPTQRARGAQARR